jgi:hypothetical protein
VRGSRAFLELTLLLGGGILVRLLGDVWCFGVFFSPGVRFSWRCGFRGEIRVSMRIRISCVAGWERVMLPCGDVRVWTSDWRCRGGEFY